MGYRNAHTRPAAYPTHLRPVVVVAGHEEGEAEGAHAARLRELLHHRGRVPHQLRHGLLLLLCVVRVGIGRGSLMGQGPVDGRPIHESVNSNANDASSITQTTDDSGVHTTRNKKPHSQKAKRTHPVLEVVRGGALPGAAHQHAVVRPQPREDEA